VAILVGSRDHQKQFWKGVIQGPFHESLIQIGPVVLEELIKMQKVNDRRTTNDGRPVVAIAHLTRTLDDQGHFDLKIFRNYLGVKKSTSPTAWGCNFHI
jgi:hypothetical protein